MSGLSDNGVNYIEAGNFVLWSAFLDELLHALHHMLVVFDGSDCTLGNGRHFGFGYGRLDLIQR